MTKNYEIIDGRCVIPHDVRHIVYKEFESAHSLREIVIPTSVDMICAYAFSYCEKLIRPEIPAAATRIGEDPLFLPNACDRDELPP